MKLEEISYTTEQDFRRELANLLESLTTILPHQLIENNSERKQYAIKCDELLFILAFEHMSPKHSVVLFYEYTEDNTKEFGNTNKFKYTGKLFATIINIIQQEIQHLDMLVYTASGNSRRSLYTSLAKKYSNSFVIYSLPTNSIELTILSRYRLTDQEKQQIVQVATERLTDK